MLAAIIISKLIYKMNIPKQVKEQISTCVFYGVKKKDNVDLYNRLNNCKTKLIIKPSFLAQ